MKMKQIQMIACLIFLWATSNFAQTENQIQEDVKSTPTHNDPSKEHGKEIKEPAPKGYKELYEDSETGQIFTKPGCNCLYKCKINSKRIYRTTKKMGFQKI